MISEELINFPPNRLSTDWMAPRDLLAQGVCQLLDGDEQVELTREQASSLAALLNDPRHQCSIRYVLPILSYFK